MTIVTLPFQQLEVTYVLATLRSKLYDIFLFPLLAHVVAKRHKNIRHLQLHYVGPCFKIS
jgi:hypothetical protein